MVANSVEFELGLDFLISWGAHLTKFRKQEYIFHEGEVPRWYFFLIEGKVKMFNLNLEGREFTQGIFYSRQSFGEPPLLCAKTYPASAMTVENSLIAKLSKENFFKLLEEEPDFMKFTLIKLAERLCHKASVSKEIINHTPEERLMAILKNIKQNSKSKQKDELMVVNLTRQELANLTGLRVETVIRTLKHLELMHKVHIINRRLYV